MFSALLSVIALAALLLGIYRAGQWPRRAREAEAKNEAIRKAHKVQNDVASDPAYRERVRRHFDGP